MSDFFDLYQTFSTTELIKIIIRLDLYQPAALDAAHRTLSNREISPEEEQQARLEAEADIARQNRLPNLYAEITHSIQTKVAYIFHPSDTFDPLRWLYIYCLCLSLLYCFSAYSILISFFSWFSGKYTMSSILIVINCFGLLFLPIMLLLLLRRELWGWKLAVFNSASAIVMEIINLLLYYKKDWAAHASVTSACSCWHIAIPFKIRSSTVF